MKHAIAVVGGNGSGKTTLGRNLSRLFGYRHLDIEDYSFFPSKDAPYTQKIPREQAAARLYSDMTVDPCFVFSSVGGDMGAQINALYDCVICLRAPIGLRLERVRRRSYESFGDRVLEGGDMYESERAFLDFVFRRSLDKLDAWLQSLNIPVLYLDASLPAEELLYLAAEKIKALE